LINDSSIYSTFNPKREPIVFDEKAYEMLLTMKSLERWKPLPCNPRNANP